MSEYNKTQNYQQALNLVDQGKHKESISLFEKHLQEVPNDTEAINDLGAVYYCIGDTDKAIAYLETAWKISPDSGEICWNLVEAYLANNQTLRAANLFNDLQRLGLENFDVYNRAAKQFVDKGNVGYAIEMLLQSLDCSPEQELLHPMMKMLKAKRPKIAFINGSDKDYKFIKDIVNHFSKRFEIKFAECADSSGLDEIMAWADIAWFEWATDRLIYASAVPKKCKIIARLHRFEAYQDWFNDICWENVDTLMLVGNSHLKKHILRRKPMLEVTTNIKTIANGIDLNKFKFQRRQRGKNIACVGYINVRKNPMLLLQCMQKLSFIDKDYKLFFAGNFQGTEVEQYMRYIVREMGLQDNIIFEGWQYDVPCWLENKHYIVSGSISESQGLGLMEGMACGLKPVIHNFPGADEIFEDKYLFNIAEQFCEHILSEDYNSTEYRRFVEQRYSQSQQFREINNLFASFERKIKHKKELSSKSVSNFASKLSNQFQTV